MPQPLIIIGTSGNALDILDIVEATNRVVPTWDLAGFLDDSRPAGSKFHGIEVLGGLRDATRHTGCLFVNAIGSDRSFRKRPELIAQTKLERDRFATLIHPLSAVSSRATLGPGTCVNPGVTVAGGVTVGAHVWLGSSCVIGHESVIDDCAMIAPRAVLSWFVRVGVAVYVGGGACIRQRVTIGERALIGLGGVVIADVAPNTTVVGNPARVLVRVPRQQGKPGDTPPPQPGISETPPGPRPGLPDRSGPGMGDEAGGLRS
ncbi:MAG TPA: NeuD/PglB/VioB family sugar acetyltransferase [Gemmataceae bacterium]|nr:NeuD/PglB/VioB family sugar acetyltransferase [Gemmataceae bacterium]